MRKRLLYELKVASSRLPGGLVTSGTRGSDDRSWPKIDHTWSLSGSSLTPSSARPFRVCHPPQYDGTVWLASVHEAYSCGTSTGRGL
jgi:hypothetical protein